MKKKLAFVLVLSVLCCLAVCASAAVLRLPAGLRELEAEAFMGDTSLDEVVLPDGLTSIGSKAFANSSVRWIHIPASVVDIAEDAFQNSALVYIDTPADSPAYMQFQDTYRITYGAAQISIRLTEPMTVGEERAFSYQVIPSFADIDVTLSPGLTLTNGNRLKVTDEGDGLITFTDSQGHSVSHTVPVMDVFHLYRAGESFGYEPVDRQTNLFFSRLNDLPDPDVTQPSTEGAGGVRIRTATEDTVLFAVEDQTYRWNASIVDGEEWLTLLKTGEYYPDYRIIQLPEVYTAQENNTSLPRTGRIRFSWDKYELIYEITQEAADTSPLEWFTFSENGDGTCTLTGYAGPDDYEGDIVIPGANGDGMPLTAIGSDAFRKAGVTGRVKIPQGVVSIGSWAFGQSKITGVDFPSSLRTIGNNVFWNCNGLQELTLPEGVTELKAQAFQYCYGLSLIRLPQSLNTFGTDAFGNIDVLTVIGTRGSQAETWANSHGYTFLVLSEMDFSESAVRNNMLALKDEYYEGRHWTNDDAYSIILGSMTYTGRGCVAFCYILSDTTFSGLPLRERYSFSYDEVRVGDILRINGNTHSVIVMEKYADHVVIAEGNYNSSIHWGRTLTKAQVEAADYLTTRYPD